jgi:hypothetical protein
MREMLGKLDVLKIESGLGMFMYLRGYAHLIKKLVISECHLSSG